MIKLCIFDLDGTLIDSLADLAAACNNALTECGLGTHETEEYRYYVGNGVIRLIERIIPPGKISPGVKDKMIALFNEYYHENYNVYTRPYEGMIPTLDSLCREGILCAVVSNKPEEFTNTIVKEFFGSRFFAVKGNIPGTPVKPDPAGVKKVMELVSEKLGAPLSGDEVLMIGDSSVDIMTAKNAEIKSVGCTWGFREEKELSDSGADYIVHAPEEILTIPGIAR